MFITNNNCYFDFFSIVFFYIIWLDFVEKQFVQKVGNYLHYRRHTNQSTLPVKFTNPEQLLDMWIQMYFTVKCCPIFTVDFCSVTSILTFTFIIIASSLNRCILKFICVSAGNALIVFRVTKVEFKSYITFLLMKLMH